MFACGGFRWGSTEGRKRGSGSNSSNYVDSTGCLKIERLAEAAGDSSKRLRWADRKTCAQGKSWWSPSGGAPNFWSIESVSSLPSRSNRKSSSFRRASSAARPLSGGGTGRSPCSACFRSRVNISHLRCSAFIKQSSPDNKGRFRGLFPFLVPSFPSW